MCSEYINKCAMCGCQLHSKDDEDIGWFECGMCETVYVKRKDGLWCREIDKKIIRRLKRKFWGMGYKWK